MTFNPDDLYDKLEKVQKEATELLPHLMEFYRETTKSIPVAFMTARLTVAYMCFISELPEDKIDQVLDSIKVWYKQFKEEIPL